MGTIQDVKKLVNELIDTKFTIKTYFSSIEMSARDLGYSFEFDNTKNTFGRCFYIQKKIKLSLPLCSENLDKIHTNIKNTILHELAHAFSVEVHGMRNGRGHGSNWKTIARQIGCSGERCFKASEVNLPKSKYSLICNSCGYSSPRHRKISSTYACTDCCNKHNNGRFTREYALQLVVN